MNRYDAAVIGSGPAGLEAAVNLKIRNKRFLLFGHPNLSTKVEKAPKIDNYLGLPGISGSDLQKAFLAHIAEMEVELRDEQVSGLYPMGSYFSIATNKDTYETTTLILATGVSTTKTYPGEEQFLGRGVGYCATCDAPLYRGKTVAVIGSTDSAVHEANFVSEIAGTVYYIPARKTPSRPVDVVQVVEGKVKEIRGEKSVTTLVLENRELAVDGVFVLRESIAPATLVPGLAVESGFIKVDADMKTNIPGCFAAGDCTGLPHQYMRAAGQGQTAALNAVSYIDQMTQPK